MKVTLEFKRLDMERPITKRPILIVENTTEGVTGAIINHIIIEDPTVLGNFYWAYFDFNFEDA